MPGKVVVVAGPDGSGKTAVADRLADVLAPSVRRLHHRPGVLPAKTRHTGPVTEPHAQTRYPLVLSVAKLGYLFTDYLLGWWLRIHPFRRAGGSVILERGWWDLLVDQRRYRLAVPSGLIRTLGVLLPRPDLTVVLEGDPRLLRSRKAELTLAELARQRDAWRSVPLRRADALYIDVASPVEAVVEQISSRLADVGRPAGAPNVRLPVAAARWSLPSAPRRTAIAGLHVYHPVTQRGLVAWWAARAVAASGGMRLLPRGCPPPVEVVDLVTAQVPPDSAMAIARTNHTGGWAVLVIDPNGRPRSFAKVALTPAGREALAREADSTQRFGGRLPGVVRAPRVLRRTASVVLFEAVPWRPRTRPWELPPHVAGALGALWRSGDGRRGPAHGDCAPWNLLRAAGGWYLIDWSDAQDAVEPFWDVLHYLVQGHALLGRPSADALVDGLLGGHGQVGAAVRAYADAAGLQARGAAVRLPSYLSASRSGLDSEKVDERRGLVARDRLLARLQHV